MKKILVVLLLVSGVCFGQTSLQSGRPGYVIVNGNQIQRGQVQTTWYYGSDTFLQINMGTSVLASQARYTKFYNKDLSRSYRSAKELKNWCDSSLEVGNNNLSALNNKVVSFVDTVRFLDSTTSINNKIATIKTTLKNDTTYYVSLIPTTFNKTATTSSGDTIQFTSPVSFTFVSSVIATEVNSDHALHGGFYYTKITSTTGVLTFDSTITSGTKIFSITVK